MDEWAKMDFGSGGFMSRLDFNTCLITWFLEISGI